MHQAVINLKFKYACLSSSGSAYEMVLESCSGALIYFLTDRFVVQLCFAVKLQSLAGSACGNDPASLSLLWRCGIMVMNGKERVHLEKAGASEVP